ncbi:MAG: 1,4-alpha-glucan branching protein GlgB [Planctomycetota bacterium]
MPTQDVTAARTLSNDDLYLFNEGNHRRLYQHLGARLGEQDGKAGAFFAVWAPNAERVTVVGDFNGYNADANDLHPQQSSGIWAGFIEGAQHGQTYKFVIRSRHNGYVVEKTDPFAIHTETPPRSAAKLWDLSYEWGDREWMDARASQSWFERPVSIYEMHMGSWRAVPEDGNRPLNYRELAEQLPAYLNHMGFTHVELMPVMEHPLLQSWGYQTTGYFAPTSRYGSPQDFMYLVDKLHQHGIGVILDWVPSHFPLDQHALSFFDGTHLFEHEDDRKGYHPDWTTGIFNYGRHEVRSFLLSSAYFWLDRYHADGLRVDAVASMLYLDYSRRDGEWIPNQFGGNENLEAIEFLKQLNTAVYSDFPGIQMIAEESTAWPGVSKPVDVGGLGFGFKWDMGWMNDTLRYFEKEPVHRRHHHNDLTFRAIYGFTENYVLPLSHDEVVHGKQSIVSKMPGDDWQKFANARLLLANQWWTPAKKLLFMGSEFAAWDEWNCEQSLAWHLAQFDRHKGVQELVRELNRVYAEFPAMHRFDCDPAGFEWIHHMDDINSVTALLRKDDAGQTVFCAFNHTPVPRPGYRFGCPLPGRWERILDTNETRFGGSGDPDQHELYSQEQGEHGRPMSLVIDLPPLAAVAYVHRG